MDKIKVRQVTKQGYILCDVGGEFDASFPKSKLRRARVQGDGWICPTLQTSNMILRIEKVNEDSVRKKI